MHGLAVFGRNVAISSLYSVHLYVFLCKHYGTQPDCYFMVIWEQPYQGSKYELPYDQVQLDILYAPDIKTDNSFRTKYKQDPA